MGIGSANLNVSWLVEAVVAFVPNPPNPPNPPPSVEDDVPNPEKPVALCPGPLFVDVAGVPKTEPVVVEDEGCTAAVGMPVAVVSGIWGFEARVCAKYSTSLALRRPGVCAK